MKTKHLKVFMDYEKEEKWLNEMAVKGFAMTSFNFLYYTFEDCVPGEYIYRIELLEHRDSHPESLRYIRFLEESGVEHVDTYNTWVYFRKKTADGDFNIYSDLNSRIKHYKRVSNFELVLSCAMLCLSFGFIRLFISDLKNGDPFWVIYSVVFLLFELSVVVLLLRLWWRYTKKIKRLEREREIQE